MLRRSLRPFSVALTLTALLGVFIASDLLAQASKPAPVPPPGKEPAPPAGKGELPTTSSVYYRTKGTTEWHLFGVYKTEEGGRAVFRHLGYSGYDVELRISNVPVPVTPPRPPSGMLPLSETVTLQKARDAFDWMNRQADIAYRFPADGCYARAHLMSQRMIKNGFKPRKVWCFANGEALYARTKNHPDGFVTWSYHVAPLLRVRFENNSQRWYVIDPSLFHEPVPVAQWEAGQMKSKESHKPYLTLTKLGQPPTLLSGKKANGTGYWPATDPKDGPDNHALALMKKYKPFQGLRPPKGLVLLPGMEDPFLAAGVGVERFLWFERRDEFPDL
jgi:hypothetical protein